MSLLQPLSPVAKLRLATEILVEYPAAWRILREPNVVEMVRFARAVEASKAPVPIGSEHDVARRLGRAVGKTLRLLPTDSRCLIQSLVLTRVLSKRGIPSQLVIGVRQAPEFQAHAWVEHAGRPVLPPGPYQRLMEI